MCSNIYIYLGYRESVFRDAFFNGKRIFRCHFNTIRQRKWHWNKVHILKFVTYLTACSNRKAIQTKISKFVCVSKICPQYAKSNVMGIVHDISSILGVHHSKYILVFTKRGLHVLISTANMTAPLSYDLTWTDFFPALKHKTYHNFTQHVTDFGHVLQDFIEQVVCKISCCACI